MSAPSLEYQHAKYINYGFLAAKAEKACHALTQNRELTPEEFSVLQNGSEFLKQVATGAKALDSGNYQVNNLKGAMDAFEFVIDPLEQLSEFFNNTDIADALNNAAETVITLGLHPSQAISDKQLKQIELFREFYEHFYTFIQFQMSQVKKDNPLGDKLRFQTEYAAYQ